jgi:predicted transcriptional regulator
MQALLSIKPQFALRIFEGVKQYEYRRSIFRRPVRRVIVYASAPIQMVIGEFVVDEVICDDVMSLWEQTSGRAGISAEEFFRYFDNRESGYAIRIGKYIKYRKARPLLETYGVAPPQSFVYLRS